MRCDVAPPPFYGLTRPAKGGRVRYIFPMSLTLPISKFLEGRTRRVESYRLSYEPAFLNASLTHRTRKHKTISEVSLLTLVIVR